MDRITWWKDWKRFGCYPFGTTSVMTEPAFVYEVLTLCEETEAECIREASNG